MVRPPLKRGELPLIPSKRSELAGWFHRISILKNGNPTAITKWLELMKSKAQEGGQGEVSQLRRERVDQLIRNLQENYKLLETESGSTRTIDDGELSEWAIEDSVDEWKAFIATPHVRSWLVTSR